MSAEILAQRYASALCGIADESDYQDLATALHSIWDAFEPHMDSVFRNPEVSKDERISLIRQAVGGNTPDFLGDFLALLVRKGRFQYLQEIVTAVDREVDRQLGRKPATVRTAFDLKDEHKEVLVKEIGQAFDSDVYLDQSVEEELLAGLQVRIEDTLMEYSVSDRLDQIQQSLP